VGADHVLTEGFQSAFLACGVLAAIGVALALALLGRPRDVPKEQVELDMLAARRASPIPRLGALKRLAEEGGAADAP
jgi:hypothetical protein